jgi:class 3 adenylate cyclase/tetratricopeptide (TPR) repeat protein
LADSLASYVPNWMVRRLLADPAPPVSAHAERFTGVVLFADLSGFTSLAEQLAQRGASGAEDLSRILNAYFGQFIELISAHGGDIIKFAGDAVLAAWTAGQDSLEITALRAAQCALAMQSKLHNYPVEAPVDALTHPAGQAIYLPLRVGIGAGEIIGVQVGGVFGRWEFLLSGDPLAQMSAASRLARPGQVILSHAAWDLVKDCCAGTPVSRSDVAAPGGMHLESVGFPVAQRRLEMLELSPAVEAALQSYVPKAMVAHLGAGQAGWLAELRRVTVLFVNLPGQDHTMPAALEVAQTTICSLQTILYRYEGSLRQFMVDDKGATLITVFGLPPLAHEDDAARGVMVAMQMADELHSMDLCGSIGVATGQVFCGFVGNEQRREYAVVGNTVNLAARLMEAGPKGDGGCIPVFCDQATYQAARSRVKFDELPKISLRGVSAPVPVYRPVESTRGPRRPRSVMIGRTNERITLANALQSLIVNRSSSVIILEGEAGIGKTRLVQDLYRQAEALQIIAFTGIGSGVEVSTPYFAWRDIFDQILGFLPPESRVQRILAWLETIESGLSQLAPVLNPVLLTSFPENELTAQMTGPARAINLHDILLRLLQDVVSHSPKIIVLEDAHWLDVASWSLAALVARQVQPLLMVIAARPMSAGWQLRTETPPGYQQLLEAPDVHQLRLGPLSNDDTLELLCQRLGIASLAEPVARQVLDKAEGHPFFAEELAFMLRDKGLLQIVGDEGRLASGDGSWNIPELPHTIQGMITSRIDRLAPAEQLTLKVASVIGRVFDYEIVREVYPFEGDKSQLVAHLLRLEQLDLAARLSPDLDAYYIFKNPIICDVAYNLMPYAQRQRLHRAVAEWYERAHAGNLTAYYGLLVHHWMQAGDIQHTLDYLEKSGERALFSGAAHEAAKFFEQALKLAGETEATFRRGRWQRLLGEAYYSLGQLDESYQHLYRATHLFGWPLPSNPLLLILGSGVQALHQALHRLGLTGLRRTLADNILKNDRFDYAIEAVRTYERLSQISYVNGEVLRGIYTALRELNLAEDVGKVTPELARAYGVMTVLTGLFPSLRPFSVRYDRLAWSVVEGLGDLAALAWVAEATASYCHGVGQWQRGQAVLERGIEASERLGEWDRWTESVGFLANTHFRRGEYERSRQLCNQTFARAQRHNQSINQAVARLAEVENLLMLGRTDEALNLWEPSVTMFERHLGRGARAQPYGVLALIRLRRGEHAQAIQAADTALQLISETLWVGLPSVWALAGFTGPAEVYLRLWEQQQGGDRATLQAGAHQACRGLKWHEFAYPSSRPYVLVYQGLYNWLEGKKERARRAWRRAIAAAEQYQTPYELGLAHYELGRHAAGSERQEHLARAGEIFERLGAAYNLERVYQALNA